jgi:DNA-binding Lrp family transcriptional regulator
MCDNLINSCILFRFVKDIRAKLLALLGKGNCTPQISQLAKKLGEPATTIHYNIKKLEEQGTIRGYKAVYNHKKLDQGLCTFILVNLIADKYADPEAVAKELAKDERVESVDIVTGEYELLVKLRTKDIDEYYSFVKQTLKRHTVAHTLSLTSLKQVKSEFLSE